MVGCGEQSRTHDRFSHACATSTLRGRVLRVSEYGNGSDIDMAPHTDGTAQRSPLPSWARLPCSPAMICVYRYPVQLTQCAHESAVRWSHCFTYFVVQTDTLDVRHAHSLSAPASGGEHGPTVKCHRTNNSLNSQAILKDRQPATQAQDSQNGRKVSVMLVATAGRCCRLAAHAQPSAHVARRTRPWRMPGGFIHAEEPDTYATHS